MTALSHPLLCGWLLRCPRPTAGEEQDHGRAEGMGCGGYGGGDRHGEEGFVEWPVRPDSLHFLRHVR